MTRQRFSGAAFEVAFEDLDAPPDSYDPNISGAAFHWIDPGVRYTKSADPQKEVI